MTPGIPNPSFHVRRFKATDVPAVLQILAQSLEAAAWSKESLEQIASSNPPAWVIEQNDTTIGFLVARILTPDEAEILNLAITPESRRAGAATKLLEATLSELTDKKIRRIHLEVRESNSRAISFYEKHNFMRTGRRPNYYREPIEAAVLLVRELTA